MNRSTPELSILFFLPTLVCPTKFTTIPYHLSLELLHDVEIMVKMCPSPDMGSMFFTRLRSKGERKCEREIIDVLVLY